MEDLQNQESQQASQSPSLPVKKSGISTASGIIIIAVVAAILFGGLFSWQYYSESQRQPSQQILNAKVEGGLANIFKITWESSGVGRVNIDLFNSNGSKNRAIADGVENKNQYEWIIDDLAAWRPWDGPYKIVISDADNNSVKAETNSFTASGAYPSDNYDQTAGWKTYTNTNCGFEFMYPANFTIKERDRAVDMCSLDLEAVKDDLAQSFGVLVNRPTGFPYWEDYKPREKLVIDGKPVEIWYGAHIDGGDTYSFFIIFEENDNSYVLVSSMKKGSKSDEMEQEKLFKKIVSTFKSIAPSQIVGLKTYDDNGVLFNYPQDWGQPKEVSLPTRMSVAFPSGTIGQYDNAFYVQIGQFFSKEGTANYQNGNQMPMTVQEIVSSIRNQPYVKSFIQQDIKVAGSQGMRIDYNYKEGGNAVTEIYIPMDNKGNILNISSDTALIGTDLFNQVILSLKFTN